MENTLQSLLSRVDLLLNENQKYTNSHFQQHLSWLLSIQAHDRKRSFEVSQETEELVKVSDNNKRNKNPPAEGKKKQKQQKLKNSKKQTKRNKKRKTFKNLDKRMKQKNQKIEILSSSIISKIHNKQTNRSSSKQIPNQKKKKNFEKRLSKIQANTKTDHSNKNQNHGDNENKQNEELFKKKNETQQKTKINNPKRKNEETIENEKKNKKNKNAQNKTENDKIRQKKGNKKEKVLQKRKKVINLKTLTENQENKDNKENKPIQNNQHNHKNQEIKENKVNKEKKQIQNNKQNQKNKENKDNKENKLIQDLKSASPQKKSDQLKNKSQQSQQIKTKHQGSKFILTPNSQSYLASNHRQIKEIFNEKETFNFIPFHQQLIQNEKSPKIINQFQRKNQITTLLGQSKKKYLKQVQNSQHKWGKKVKNLKSRQEKHSHTKNKNNNNRYNHLLSPDLKRQLNFIERAKLELEQIRKQKSEELMKLHHLKKRETNIKIENPKKKVSNNCQLKNSNLGFKLTKNKTFLQNVSSHPLIKNLKLFFQQNFVSDLFPKINHNRTQTKSNNLKNQALQKKIKPKVKEQPAILKNIRKNSNFDSKVQNFMGSKSPQGRKRKPTDLIKENKNNFQNNSKISTINNNFQKRPRISQKKSTVKRLEKDNVKKKYNRGKGKKSQNLLMNPKEIAKRLFNSENKFTKQKKLKFLSQQKRVSKLSNEKSHAQKLQINGPLKNHDNVRFKRLKSFQNTKRKLLFGNQLNKKNELNMFFDNYQKGEKLEIESSHKNGIEVEMKIEKRNKGGLKEKTKRNEKRGTGKDIDTDLILIENIKVINEKSANPKNNKKGKELILGMVDEDGNKNKKKNKKRGSRKEGKSKKIEKFKKNLKIENEENLVKKNGIEEEKKKEIGEIEEMEIIKRNKRLLKEKEAEKAKRKEIEEEEIEKEGEEKEGENEDRGENNIEDERKKKTKNTYIDQKVNDYSYQITDVENNSSTSSESSDETTDDSTLSSSDDSSIESTSGSSTEMSDSTLFLKIQLNSDLEYESESSSCADSGSSQSSSSSELEYPFFSSSQEVKIPKHKYQFNIFNKKQKIKSKSEKLKIHGKIIPNWALKSQLKSNLLKQNTVNPDTIFTKIEKCDLNQIFSRKKRKYTRRKSSIFWTEEN
ncbi:synaptic vesicle membrane protein vat-1 homolog-like [Anaeramoeba flamelloides]|uniref:Synaptic vesicle membrane protein vat-1 homolog-like n=1 Tax=Anaeramoeba flamelloides TaxID=1746091 RepID=A0AAV7ZIJ5_9EUKA|nr:synaptic vesicle membrane protein vat-1 homolog-like [Anaeramoeba flamelloides]